jgi:Carboxypeptidase regulatory-like domain
VSGWQTVRHRVAIAGRVLDAGTGKPVTNAAVSITTMPPAFQNRLAIASLAYGRSWDDLLDRPDRTSTRKDGLFCFLDLPDGKYGLSGSMPSHGNRYGVAQGSAEVSRDSKGNFKIAFLTLTPQATTVKGRITGSSHKNGVVLAEVRVKGSGERTFTDAQGQYEVAGIEPGKRVLMVSAQGYRAVSEPITLGQPGASQTLNFNLTRESG